MTDDDKFTAMMRDMELCWNNAADCDDVEGRQRASHESRQQAADWAALRERYVAMRLALDVLTSVLNQYEALEKAGG